MDASDAAGSAVVVNGRASILHERASDPTSNLERERPGIGPNEVLWAALRATNSDLEAAYAEACESFAEQFPSDYAEVFRAAHNEWQALFETPDRREMEGRHLLA